ncbi:hypothetical protein GN244_ATG09526 [Phytophthora infestans]|uniref:Uncharacterized protein n=1 Tax=Phytophthora infestans TaxID=4787 RepID=A0A833T3A7_PHYIN|nr:hypothetical protein GN244_ATG09526 [Phytophthora infestans]
MGARLLNVLPLLLMPLLLMPVHPSPRPHPLLLAHLLFFANCGEAISSECCHAPVVHVTRCAAIAADAIAAVHPLLLAHLFAPLPRMGARLLNVLPLLLMPLLLMPVHPSPRPHPLLLAHLLFSANCGEAISSECCHAPVVHVTRCAAIAADAIAAVHPLLLAHLFAPLPRMGARLLNVLPLLLMPLQLMPVHPSPRPRPLLIAHLFALLFSANGGEAISSECCHAPVVHVTISAHFSADRAEE